MRLEHRGHAPVVDPTAYVAPTAVLCGDVHVGPDARILFGAVLTAGERRGRRPLHRDGARAAARAPRASGPARRRRAGRAEVFAPGRHDEIWAVQERLDFPQTVYGLPREASARERMERQAAWFAAHRDDRPAR